jgi:hypothetical protein
MNSAARGVLKDVTLSEVAAHLPDGAVAEDAGVVPRRIAMRKGELAIVLEIGEAVVVDQEVKL